MAKLHDFYKESVVPQLAKEFGYKSVMQVPRIEKITLNMGLGEALTDKKIGEHTSELQSHHDLVCRLLLEKKK